MSDFFELQQKIKGLTRTVAPYVQASTATSYNAPSPAGSYGAYVTVPDIRVAQDIQNLSTVVTALVAQQNIIIEFLQHQFDAT